MRLTHIALSVWLSMLLIFGSTAKEFIHLFAGHHDTVHATHVKGELSFENEHHHCSFLSFALPDFYHDTTVHFVERISVDFPVYTAFLPALHTEQEIIRNLSRGPPAV